MEDKNTYELAIIGAGPAGLSASVYASRFGVKHVVFGGLMGGTISEAHVVDNYLGIEDINGLKLSQKFLKHAKKYGTEIIPDAIKKIEKKADTFFEIDFNGDKKIFAKTILLATGTKRKKIGIKGEDEFLGKGVSYCATCDGFFYKDKVVGVIGGANSAVSAAIYLAEIARKVYLIYRKDNLPAEEYWTKLLAKNEKIETLYNLNVVEILGEKKIEKVKLDGAYEGKNEIVLDGLFIECGSDPRIDFTEDLGTEKDKEGFIKIQKDGATSVQGVWAAGDITDGSNKFSQVITAASEGAIAAKSIYNYLRKNK
jgi:thioredoxin reductase (NADPH)